MENLNNTQETNIDNLIDNINTKYEELLLLIQEKEQEGKDITNIKNKAENLLTRIEHVTESLDQMIYPGSEALIESLKKSIDKFILEIEEV